LYKSKGDILSPNSYQGIANCYIMYKLFDKIVCNDVYYFTSHLIPKVQYGFMPGRSTIQAISYLHSHIMSALSVVRGNIYMLCLWIS
jgi:hypothetical protein